MPTEAENLGRRAVQCPHWRWMAGMLDTMGGRVVTVTTDLISAADDYGSIEAFTRNEWEGSEPDLTDPATLGCLLALVREAWGDPRASQVSELDGFSGPRWIVYGGDADELSPWLTTEAEALVAALEAADAD